MSAVDEGVKNVLTQLEQAGLLLESDSSLPSVCQVVTGAPIKGSWWGHELGKVIYAVCGTLEDHPDVVRVKLLFGKITYVHRELWPALLTVVTAHDSWQVSGLSAEAADLFEKVEQKGVLTAEEESRAAVQMLEKRMLVLSANIHTPSGRHVKELESWSHWLGRTNFKPAPIARKDGYLNIERVAADVCGIPLSKALPWVGGHTLRTIDEATTSRNKVKAL
jgi:hypothetical protein